MKKYINTTLLEYLNDEKLNSNFWKWFENSKAIDDNGNPIIFYHGSHKNFNIFKNSNPIWFTKYKGYAEAFCLGKCNIFEVFIKIVNPLYIGNIDGIANDKKLNYLSELTNINKDILKDILKETNGVNIFNITNSQRFKNIIEEGGYDGLIAKEGNGLTTYAVFNSYQIKSIKNNGNWDINNYNINK